MDARETAQSLLNELQGVLGNEPLTLDDQGAITFDVDGCRLVSLGVEEEFEALTLLSPLTADQDDRPGDVYRALLEANFMWRDTRGATVALDTNSNTLVLQQRLPLAGLTAESLQEHLATFLNLLDGFAKFLAETTADANEAPADENQATGMRV